MKILAISGSLKSTSSNTAILRAIAKLADASVDFIIYDGLGVLPHFSPEIDTEEPLTPVKDLRDKLKAADGVIISTPEYAFGVSGSLNICSTDRLSGELVEKPAAVISASLSFMGGIKLLFR
jgi:NAD(P)H-dependent FMN reductase